MWFVASWLFFGGREATTANTSVVRRPYAGKHVELCWVLKRLPFVRKFRWKISVTWYWYFFLASKTVTGLSCTIYKIPVNFLLSLDMKPGTTESKQMVQKTPVVSGKTGKRYVNIPRKVLLFFLSFFWKISTEMNSSNWILLGISEFSIQMVSASDMTDLDLGHITTSSLLCNRAFLEWWKSPVPGSQDRSRASSALPIFSRLKETIRETILCVAQALFNLCLT